MIQPRLLIGQWAKTVNHTELINYHHLRNSDGIKSFSVIFNPQTLKSLILDFFFLTSTRNKIALLWVRVKIMLLYTSTALHIINEMKLLRLNSLTSLGRIVGAKKIIVQIILHKSTAVATGTKLTYGVFWCLYGVFELKFFSQFRTGWGRPSIGLEFFCWFEDSSFSYGGRIEKIFSIFL